ncbi:MAG: hypothetical protein ACTSYD_01605 [Candidatus Heimdallarchaeaceae archaeon]
MMYLWHLLLSHIVFISLVILVLIFCLTKNKCETELLQKLVMLIYGVNIFFPLLALINGATTKQFSSELHNFDLFSVTFGKYLIPIGITISNIQFSFYVLFIVLPSVITLYYLAHNHLSLCQSLIILALQLFSILFLFSDNFIQLIFSIFGIEFLLAVLLNGFQSQIRKQDGFTRTFLFSTLLADVFVFTSLILLTAKIKSFGYIDFQSAFEYHLILSNPYYQLTTIFLVIGVIVKLGTFPFQAWLRKIPETFITKKKPIAFILSVYILFPLLILLVTPIRAIIFLCSPLLLWYGIISGFIGIMTVYFLSSKIDDFFGFVAVYQSIIMILLSFEHISVVTSMAMSFPCISAIFISIPSHVTVPTESKNSLSSFEKWSKKLLTGWWLAIFLLFSIGMIPFNNIFLSFNTKWVSSNDLFTSGVILSSAVIMCLFSFMLFKVAVRNLKLLFNPPSFSYFNLIMSIFLVLNFVLSPIFNWIKFDDATRYTLSYYYAIFFGANIAFLLILLSLSTFLRPKQPLLKSIVLSMQKVLVHIYVPVIYHFIVFLYNKVLIRVYLWIKLIFVESIIVEFLYGKITFLLSELTTYLFTLFEKVIVFLSSTVVFTSINMKKFDKLKFKWQVVVILLIIAGIFATLFIYYIFKVK